MLIICLSPGIQTTLPVSDLINGMFYPEIPFRRLTDDGYVEISGQKIYYMTMVIDLRYNGERQNNVYRITFNRSGILKVDSFQKISLLFCRKYLHLWKLIIV